MPAWDEKALIVRAVRFTMGHFIVPVTIATCVYALMRLAFEIANGRKIVHTDILLLILVGLLRVLDIYWLLLAFGATVNLFYRLVSGSWYEGERTWCSPMLDAFRHYSIASPAIMRYTEPMVVVKQTVRPLYAVPTMIVLYVLITTPVTVTTRWLEKLSLGTYPVAVGTMWIDYFFRNSLIALAATIVTLLAVSYGRYVVRRSPEATEVRGSSRGASSRN